MARNSVIGALRVSLGLDSAQFQTGLKSAETGMGRFSKTAKVAFAAVAAAGAAAAVSLAHAVKQAADHADQLSKTSQRLGMTVEALSQLEYAGRMAGVSTETLSMALQRFTRRSAEAADGTGEAKVALQAMGITLRDAEGNLRSTQDLLYDVSDALKRVEDPAMRVRLAFKLFDSEGVKLLNMLDGGADGLRRMAAESDRLGQTISSKTGKAAEEFNDNLTRLNGAMGGVSNRIMEAVIPSLNDLTKTFQDPAFQTAVIGTVKLFVDLANVLARTAQLAYELTQVLPKTTSMSADKPPGWEQLNEQFGIGAGANSNDTGNGAGSFSDMLTKMGIGSGISESAEPFVVDMTAVSGAAKTAKEAIDPLAARMEELSGVLTTTHDPFEQMKMDLTDLRTLWEQGRISVEQYEAAVVKTQMNAAASTLGMVSNLTGALSDMFKDNKAFAIANAVVNTAEGITKALAQGGILGFAGAAAVAASGAAQIGAILTAQPGTSSAPSVSEPALADAPSGGGGPGISLTLTGGGRYSRDEVVAVLESINEFYGDTGKINLVGAA